MTFFEYFDRVWIISMINRTDRRRRIGRELSRIGLPITPGKVEFFDGISADSSDGFPSKGYHGCFLSHRAVMEEGLRLGSRRILVFEDDVVFRPNFTTHEYAALTALDRIPNWGVVQFGCIGAETVQGKGLIATPERNPSIMGLHFYGINGWVLPRIKSWYDAALERPAGHPDGGRMSPDGTMNHFRWANPDVPTFLYTPVLGQQSNSPSDIAPRKWFDKVPLAGSLIRRTRDLLHQEKWD